MNLPDPNALGPGLQGYVQGQQQAQQQVMLPLQMALQAQSLKQHFEEQANRQRAQAAVQALGPNPKEEDVLRAIAPFTGPKDLMSHYASLAGRREAADARREVATTAAEARAEATRARTDMATQAASAAAERAAETARHNKEMERLAGNRLEINQTSKEPLSEEAVKDLAIQSLYDPTATSGYRRDTTAMSRIANARQKVMKDAGVTSEDVVSGRAGFKADTMSLNKITPMYDAVTAFEKTAVRNGRVLKELGDKVDTTGTPVIERWIRGGRRAIGGDADVAQFNAQMNVYRNEAAKILTNPNLTGVLTVDARREMEHVLAGDASAAQIRGVVDLLERDFTNRKQTMEEQIGSIRARMRGRVAPGGGGGELAAPAPGQPAPVAAPQSDDRSVKLPDGRIKTFPTPAAAAAFRKAAGL